MKIAIQRSLSFLVLLSLGVVGVFAQARPGRQVLFAVLGNGGTLEPVAMIEKGKLEPPTDGAEAPAELFAFAKAYYKKGTAYKLIFGGANGGTSTVKSSNPASDCAKNIAQATTKSLKTPLKGFVMALATNAPIKSTTSVRRKPTAAEKAEADALAKAEFAKHKLAPKVLRFHNLTALDFENDGKAELVGSYWVEIDKLTRGLLFFIAGQGSNGKYSVGYQEYRSIDQGSVMSGAIKDVDDGILHETLLDVFDYDGDGTSEVFTHTQSFEGAGFNAYKRNGSKWTRAYEFSNYHCAF